MKKLFEKKENKTDILKKIYEFVISTCWMTI